MTASERIHMNSMPSTPPLLLRAALARKSRKAPLAFPQASIEVDHIEIDPNQLDRYKAVCGFSQQDQILPMSFLHVLAFRLQMSMMLQKDFPVAPMGCIHLSNTLRQFRPLQSKERPTLRCEIAASELTSKGVEFSFSCGAYVDGEKVWEDDSRYLSRRKTGISANKTPPQPKTPYRHCEYWQVNRSHARGYARASGDFNPIHLHDVSAKLLGFKRMIIHGMWSQAACLAALDKNVAQRSECHAEFKTPIYLPARVQFCYEHSDGGGTEFGLRSEDGQKPHLNGYLRPI